MEEILKKNRSYYGMVSIVFLNAFDGMATFIGLRYGFYIELNKFLSMVYNLSPVLFLIIKVILPTILIIVLIDKMDDNISKITRLIIFISNVIYICLCIYHIILYAVFVFDWKELDLYGLTLFLLRRFMFKYKEHGKHECVNLWYITNHKF